MHRFLTITAAVALAASPAFAADYDEAVNGDLGGLDSPTTFDVDLGTNSVTGTVGLGGSLDEDFIVFDIDPGEQLDAITITDFELATGNLSTGFRLYFDDGTDLIFADGTSVTPDDVGTNLLTVWDLTDVGGTIPLTAGTYGVLAAEFTEGQNYGFDIVVSAVPEPTSLGLLGLGGLALLRRRK